MNALAPRSRRDRGFTLVEILVAFALVALVFGAALEAFSGGLRASALAADHAFAAAVAEGRLAEAVAAPDLSPGEHRGVVTAWQGDPRGMTWRTTVTRFEAAVPATRPGAGPEPLLVSVRVTWPDGARTREIEVSTFAIGAGR